MRPLIVIPAVHEATTRECVARIDQKFHRDVIVIDNSRHKFARSLSVGHVVAPELNLGVARSWNLGVDLLRHTGRDFLVILSASVQFNDGMNSFLQALEANQDQMGLMTQEGWHCIALHRRVFEAIGRFDTNFYPAYYEDSDFIRRMELARIHEPCGSITLPGTTIDADRAQVAHGMKLANIQVNMGACRDYFVEKWGAEPVYTSQAERDKMFKHPFNNSRLALGYFPERSIPELKFRYNLQ